MTAINRQVQQSGSRRWWGNQLQNMQDSLYAVLEEAFLASACGMIILKKPVFDTNHTVTEEGYILIRGTDGYKVCRVYGDYSNTGNQSFYLTQSFTEVQRVYTDSGAVKRISKEYYAKDNATTPTDNYYIEVRNLSNFRDQDANPILEFSDFFVKKSVAEDHNLSEIDASKLGGLLPSSYVLTGTTVIYLEQVSPERVSLRHNDIQITPSLAISSVSAQTIFGSGYAVGDTVELG